MSLTYYSLEDLCRVGLLQTSVSVFKTETWVLEHFSCWSAAHHHLHSQEKSSAFQSGCLSHPSLLKHWIKCLCDVCQRTRWSKNMASAYFVHYLCISEVSRSNLRAKLVIGHWLDFPRGRTGQPKAFVLEEFKSQLISVPQGRNKQRLISTTVRVYDLPDTVWSTLSQWFLASQQSFSLATVWVSNVLDRRLRLCASYPKYLPALFLKGHWWKDMLIIGAPVVPQRNRNGNKCHLKSIFDFPVSCQYPEPFAWEGGIEIFLVIYSFLSAQGKLLSSRNNWPSFLTEQTSSDFNPV